MLVESFKDNKVIWTLERWARLRSYIPPEAIKLLLLKRYDRVELAYIYKEKTEVLLERFFLEGEVDTSDITEEEGYIEPAAPI